MRMPYSAKRAAIRASTESSIAIARPSAAATAGRVTSSAVGPRPPVTSSTSTCSTQRRTSPAIASSLSPATAFPASSTPCRSSTAARVSELVSSRSVPRSSDPTARMAARMGGDPDGQWSAPVRVGGDNQVPDITPDVTAVGDGALVAWSRFDGGEYRVYTARFAGGRFGPATPAAEPGSLFPTFERDGARAALLFRDARRRGWGLREIGDDGAPGRTGRVAELGAGRPLVRLGERGVEWEFAATSEATAWE
jgi:hypothetical protein